MYIVVIFTFHSFTVSLYSFLISSSFSLSLPLRFIADDNTLTE
nr:MAG TPA: hypothetical protein [Caudoviricetes sp.]